MITPEEKALMDKMSVSAGQMARLLFALANAENDQQELELVNAIQTTCEALQEGADELADAREGTPLIILT